MKRGVTLIALVVTIIVLLILVAATVSLVLGPDGIVKKATETQVAGRYGTIMDKLTARDADSQIALRTGEVGESQEDFIGRMVAEGLITSEDEYDDYGTIYLGRQSDGTYKYVIDVADYAGDESFKNMTLIIRTTAANRTVTLPISNATGLEINWNAEDPTSNFEPPVRAASPYNAYPQAGTYEVQIKGTSLEGAFFGSRTDGYSNTYIVGIKYWGENGFSEINSFGRNLQGVIPLPSRNSFKNVTSFDYTFQGCYTLTSIPSRLFANCPNVTSFDSTFTSCGGLTSIPTELFSNCPNVMSFRSTFKGCYSLTSIPTGLFSNCPNVISFRSTFDRCQSLTSIPENLFSNCPNVQSFQEAFIFCTGLTGNIPEGLFDNCQYVAVFSATFYGCEGLTGNAPNLWDRTNNPNGQGCFYGCLELDNYDIIPPYWKSVIDV